MPVQLRAAVLACDNPAAAAAFWARVLSRNVVPDALGLLVPGDDEQLGLRFVPSATSAAAPSTLHLHLASTSLEHQQATVEAALDAGAAHLDVGQRPEEGHVVLADPGGNALCVIGPGSTFLAGCGFLAEIACDGSRGVGVFWSAALDWPLVWDRDGETAIQSPRGGTKVAWGGESPPPGGFPPAERFELLVVGGDAATEVDRLVALGAGARRPAGRDVVLTDPDGVRFRVVAG